MFLLKGLSNVTGGLHFTVRFRADLPAAAQKIARAMKNVYVIGYQPPADSAPGKWRRIHVTINSSSRRSLRVSAKHGYYEPNEMTGRSLLLAAALSLPAPAADRPTDHQAHAWFAYFGDHPVAGSKSGVHLEAQVRRHDMGTSWQQLLLRPGVNYQASKTLMLTAGYTFARSHTYNEHVAQQPATNEHRVWHQAWFRIWLPCPLEYQTATREPVHWNARRSRDHRLPVRESLSCWQQATVPISPRVYLRFDEARFYVKPYVSNSVFDQNRAYGGVGVHVTPTLRFEVAYMNQALLLRSGARLEQNHTIVLSILGRASLLGR